MCVRTLVPVVHAYRTVIGHNLTLRFSALDPCSADIFSATTESFHTPILGSLFWASCRGWRCAVLAFGIVSARPSGVWIVRVLQTLCFVAFGSHSRAPPFFSSRIMICQRPGCPRSWLNLESMSLHNLRAISYPLPVVIRRIVLTDGERDDE